MPGNALSFKRVKWYHMHMHCRIIVNRRCVIAYSLSSVELLLLLLLVEFEGDDNVIDYEIFM